MKKGDFYQYYVEGSNERSIINALKMDLGVIKSGKVDVFNIVQELINYNRIRQLKSGTNIVLVYDTDVENTLIMQQNIDFLKKQKCVSRVICIPQVKCLEDELLRACNIDDIKILTNSKDISDFKSDLNKCTNIGSRLKKCEFNISEFWNKKPHLLVFKI